MRSDNLGAPGIQARDAAAAESAAETATAAGLPAGAAKPAKTPRRGAKSVFVNLFSQMCFRWWFCAEARDA
jgi:hypothetical protein